MEAATLDMVMLKLQEAGNVPLARQGIRQGIRSVRLRMGRRGMNTREVGQFTQQLSTLLGAGLPLDRSLQVLLELSENERVKRTVAKSVTRCVRVAVFRMRWKSSMARSIVCSSIWFVPAKSVARWMSPCYV